MITRHTKVELGDAVEGMLRCISSTAWCQACNELVELLTVKEASTMTGANPLTLLFWVVKERIHCLDQQGRLHICATSLRRSEAVTGELNRRLS